MKAVFSLFRSKKFYVSHLFMAVLIVGASAQEPAYYDIISATGKIVDKSSGKELQVGDKVYLQTELEFNSLYDRAVLLSPSKSKYFLEVPKASYAQGQLIVTSDVALQAVKNRPALMTGVRGNSVMQTDGVSKETLETYFGVDTFTIIGNTLALPVTKADAGKYNLMLRYETDTGSVEDYLAPNFTINKNALKMKGNKIAECYVMYKDKNQTIPVTVTQVSLFFVDKAQLYAEFDSMLKAMNQSKKDKNTARETLRQYCTDVYGLIDRAVLESTINDYLALK